MQRFFFDDCPSHVGYGPSGVHTDSSNVPYNHNGKDGFNDRQMRQAIKNVMASGKWTGDKYNFVFHNCQDFVYAVLKEYEKLYPKTFTPPRPIYIRGRHQ